MGDVVVGSDAYVVVQCEGKECRTPVRKDTLDPLFNTQMMFYVKRPERAEVVLQVCTAFFDAIVQLPCLLHVPTLLAGKHISACWAFTGTGAVVEMVSSRLWHAWGPITESALTHARCMLSVDAGSCKVIINSSR